MPLLQRPEQWEVLVAHYLGVDHAGHTFGVRSRQMVDKVQQMDEQLDQVVGQQRAQGRGCRRPPDAVLQRQPRLVMGRTCCAVRCWSGG